MRGSFSFLSKCMLLVLVTLPVKGSAKTLADMSAAWKQKWNICLRNGVTPSPSDRLAACNYIVSLGESGNPNATVYAGAFWQRAEANCEVGRMTDAWPDFNKAIAYSQEKQVLKTMLWSIFVARAKCRMKVRQFAEAAEDIDTAFEKHPFSFDTVRFKKEDWMLIMRGDAAIGLDKYTDAISFYEREFRQNPSTPGLAEKLAAARKLQANVASSQSSSQVSIEVDLSGKKQSQAKAQGRRIALVIGISNYLSVPILSNPGRDAALVAETLKRIGFEAVTLKTNLDRNGFIDTLHEFALQAENADWALVYYAGHGIEVAGVNYLIPTDAKILSDRDVSLEAISLDHVRNAVGRAKRLRLIVLDACRDNPFANQMRRTLSVASRSVAQGLAAVEPEAGTLIVYAAKDGETAIDGDGLNSPFTTAFVANVRRPGLEVRRLFDNVRDDVMDATKHKQQPFTYGSLSGRQDFYFVAEQ